MNPDLNPLVFLQEIYSSIEKICSSFNLLSIYTNIDTILFIAKNERKERNECEEVIKILEASIEIHKIVVKVLERGDFEELEFSIAINNVILIFY